MLDFLSGAVRCTASQPAMRPPLSYFRETTQPVYPSLIHSTKIHSNSKPNLVMQTGSNPLTISFKKQHNKWTVRQKAHKKIKDYLQKTGLPEAGDKWDRRGIPGPPARATPGSEHGGCIILSSMNGSFHLPQKSRGLQVCAGVPGVKFSYGSTRKTSNLTSPAWWAVTLPGPNNSMVVLPLIPAPRISLLVPKQGGQWNSGPLACWTSTLPLHYIPSPASLFQCLDEILLAI